MAERVLVVVSYQTRGEPYPGKLIGEVTRGLRYIFRQKSKVEMTVVVQESQILRVLEALETKTPISFKDPPVKERGPRWVSTKSA